MTVCILAGDCLEVMPKLLAEGVVVDSIVTDPPYHLTSIVKRFGGENAAPCKSGKTGAYKRHSTGFMGKKWDGGDIAFQPEVWELALQILKPGGHMLTFGGTRTYHRMACAVEDAGFEIRDQVGWLFGSGFPKSHDVSKGIDRARKEDLEPVRIICRFLRAAMDLHNFKSRHLTKYFGDCHSRLIDHWAARDTDSQPELPTLEQWSVLKRILQLSDEKDVEVWRLNGRKGQPGDAFQNATVLGEYKGDAGGLGGERFSPTDGLIRAPATEPAQQWNGWGTALKPAWEPLVLARKPLSEKTIAANVLEHGTGALNVDGCRVEIAPADDIHAKNPHTLNKQGAGFSQGGAGADFRVASGRWPANVIHDGSEEVLEAFARFGESSERARTLTRNGPRRMEGWGLTGKSQGVVHGDHGTPARFFYAAKADAADRCGSNHPTVKPVDLIAYLCRMITSPGGTVLDPFAGSGTTAMACIREGFDCILIEREAEYIADIRKRLDHVAGADTPLFADAGMFAEVV